MVRRERREQPADGELRAGHVVGVRAADGEVAQFLRHPLAADAMVLRRWDDLAKDPAAQPLPAYALLDAAPD